MSHGYTGKIVITIILFIFPFTDAQARQTADTKLRTEVSRFGITWTFDRPARSGQFINGDWWVVGPVTIVKVTPRPGPVSGEETMDLPVNRWGDTGLQDNKEMRNGSMVIMEPGNRQAYDSRGRTFDDDLSINFPYELPAERSLISSVSHTDLPNRVMHHELMWDSEQYSRNVMKTAAVLTSLSEVPPADAFRPSYTGSDKRLFRAGALQWDRLMNLPLPPETDSPSWEQFERYFERPWLDHLNGSWAGQQLLPIENQPAYGREFARMVSIASLMLHLDAPQDRKRALLIGLVQYGIDLRGIAETGGNWNEGGGHTSGRKWPILFAGLMLGEEYFADMPGSAIFHEDVQTYYGRGWDGQTALWQMIIHHGRRKPYEHIHPDEWENYDDGWATTSESYRVCCNARAWVGTALVSQLMEAKRLWNHDAFFDNVERWMRQEGSTFDPFVDAMWHQYRPEVPRQPDGDTHRKWVRIDGVDQWVPNEKPLAHQPMPDPDVYVKDVLANPMLTQTTGELFAWHARGAANDLVAAYEAYRDPRWLEAAERYFTFLTGELQTDPDGYQGWIGQTIWGETGRAPGDEPYRADALVGDAILLAPIVRFAEIVLSDPDLERRFGDRAREYVELAEHIGWEKWNHRATYYRDAAGYGSYKMHDYLIEAATWQWKYRENGDRRRSDNLNKHHSMGLVLLRLYRITGKEPYRERVVEIFSRAKNLFRLLPDERLTWNFWMPHGPHDLREDGSMRSWAAVHPNRSGYQSGEVGRFIELYDSGLVFDREDLQRMINTNRWMYRGEGKWQSSDGSTDAGQLWSSLARFDDWIFEQAAAGVAGSEGDRGRIRQAYFRAVEEANRGWARRFMQDGETAEVYDFAPRPGKNLSMTMIIPNRFSPASGESVRMVTQSRAADALRIELMDAAGVRVLGVIHESDTPGSTHYLAPEWDGTNPATGAKQPGEYQIRWTLGDEQRMEQVWVQ
ncbi:MAG: hypothetical protein WDZ53_08320 [Balneolales bacterium]